MALVYEARRESLEGVSPRVAIKLILPEHRNSDTFRELFINEARLGASMHHQNLVQIQDFDCEEDTYFLVMEYVEGITLRRAIALCERGQKPIPMGVIAEIGRQACDGLHFAHTATDEAGRSLKLVHRDVKPSNLILSPHGVVKVLDFGISKGILRPERAGSVKGTWGYMAPEQAMGAEIGPAADVFGLATVLYELAALRPMFGSTDKEEIRLLLQDDHAARVAATLDAQLYGPLITDLVRALHLSPAARFEAADDLGRALSALLPDPITARDEVIAFYHDLQRIDQGLAPRPTLPGTRPDGVPPVRVASSPIGDIATFLAGIAISIGVLTTFTVGAALVIGGARGSWRGNAMAPLDPNAEVPIAVGTEPKEDPQTLETAAASPADAPSPRPVSSVRTPAPSDASVATSLEPSVEGISSEDTVAEVASTEGDPGIDPAAMGTLVVDAKQAAEVYIDGGFVDRAPVRTNLPIGRYSVILVATDGRTRTFEVDIVADERVKRVWDFERTEWR